MIFGLLRLLIKEWHKVTSLCREDIKTKTHAPRMHIMLKILRIDVDKNVEKARVPVRVLRHISSRRTEWSVEPTSTVHVLAVLDLLLLAHAVDVVSRHFGILSGSELGESHTSAHHLFHFILVGVLSEIHIHLLFVAMGAWRAIGLPSIMSRPRVSSIRLTIDFGSSGLR